MTKGTDLPDKEPSIRIIAMPADTNPSGDIFGGWLMSMMDMAGANIAYKRAGGRVATIAVDKIEFHRPVAIGDIVSCYADIIRSGRSSISTKVEVWVRRRVENEQFKVTEGEFTYVAISNDGKSRPLPED
ncbi:MAG: acyl-CoA thioesterase [Rhodospirillaceae bacterium]|nr:acyl-CoA thioesterase [Rhodospirillaceae bacterium]|tara:strand:+ start:127 stop:516 length:390 start_codon:yes stop_codon:yes gene_type:complete